VALAVLMIGVFGVGVVTALSRSGDQAKPSAQPSPTGSFETPSFSAAPTTEPPVETPEPTETPAVTPTAAPSVSGNNGGGNGSGSGGDGSDAPDMPNTGGSPALAALALAAGTTALGVRRAVRR
jgi:hypothetical protein